MAGDFGKIELDGYDELRRQVRKAKDTDLPKRMGLAHKFVGQLVIARLHPRPDPAAVGKGGGAAVRPSAAKREVLLRVGGKHRDGAAPQALWGKKYVPVVRGRNRPERPYIRKTVEDNRAEIESEFLSAITDAMAGAFHDVK